MSRRPFSSTDRHRFSSPEDRAELREQLRRKLFEDQGGKCWLCGEQMTLLRGRRNPGRKFASFDHVVPKADGGTTYHTNLKLAHRMCNSARHHRSPPTVNGSP